MNTIDFGENTSLWLDRLACGELEEGTRRSLFTWLDAEPARWRSCALTFLEAQTWNESLGFEASNVATEVGETFGPAVRRGRETRVEQRFRWLPVTSIAAALLVAFSLGAFFRGGMPFKDHVVMENPRLPLETQGVEKLPAERLMANVSLQPEAGSPNGATMQFPVVALRNSAEPASSSISEYDRQKWERRGYQLTKERRYLPAQLPDGKKVVVPVEQVKANYVGSKVS